jgi:predicted transcriptional regulator
LKPNRARLLALMEILYVLREGPMIRNKLSHVCNLNFQRLVEMLDHLEKMGLVSRIEMQGGHDLYSLSPDGLKVSMNYQWINAMVIGDAPAPESMPEPQASAGNG